EAQLMHTRLRLSAGGTVDLARHNLQLTRTPLRKAIALLLYRPELARAVMMDDLALRSGEPGVKLLAELIGGLRANPDLSIAALLERYRDTREGAILERLAQWRLETPEEEYQFEQEFADIVAYLRRRNDPREHLLGTLHGTPRALSFEEREELQSLGKPQKI
ncbi:MAG: hypothetical protein WBQ37_07425, partial [Candidatus Competibacter sp.]